MAIAGDFIERQSRHRSAANQAYQRAVPPYRDESLWRGRLAHTGGGQTGMPAVHTFTMRRALFLAVAVLGLPLLAAAHTGGPIDNEGCHPDRRIGNYHCHLGPAAGYAFENKSAMEKAVSTGNLPDRTEPEEGFLSKLWPFGKKPTAAPAGPASAPAISATANTNDPGPVTESPATKSQPVGSAAPAVSTSSGIDPTVAIAPRTAAPPPTTPPAAPPVAMPPTPASGITEPAHGVAPGATGASEQKTANSVTPDHPAAHKPARATATPAERLTTLQELLDANLITKDEYEAKRQAVLDQL